MPPIRRGNDYFIISDLYPRNFYTDRKQRWNDQQIVVDDSFERMSGYKYFGIVDHDEIILPYRRWTIKQMLVNRKSCLLDTRVERPPLPQLAKVYTVKHVLRGHSKIDKTKIVMTNGSLMKVESIAAILLTCIKR